MKASLDPGRGVYSMQKGGLNPNVAKCNALIDLSFPIYEKIPSKDSQLVLAAMCVAQGGASPLSHLVSLCV